MPAISSLTIEQYAALPEQLDADGNQLEDELVEGELIFAPRASSQHTILVKRIAEALRPVERLGLYVLVEAPLPVSSDKGASVLGSDVMVVNKADYLKQAAVSTYAQVTPLLAIEVVSPGNGKAELARKARIMRGAGVRTVWIFHPIGKTADVYEGSNAVVTITDAVRFSHFGTHLMVPIQPLFDFGVEPPAVSISSGLD